MTKVLLAGFTGSNNSSKIVLDKASSSLSKLYLKNDFNKCKEQIEEAISLNQYQYIFALGQKPVIKSIYIELVGCSKGISLNTNFKYESLVKHLTHSGYKVRISYDAGNYLCNHVYFNGLNEIFSHSSKSQLIFIHIPCLKNICDVSHLANSLSDFLISL